MKPLTFDDLLDIAAYEKVRERRLAEVIALKTRRRLAVGPMLTLLFENRETVRSQIQEMMRAERMVDERAIREELEVYSPLIPSGGELSATLFIEVADQTRVREVLDRFIGLDEGGRVFLRFARGATVPAEFEAGRSREDRISAVHFVKFRPGEKERRAFRVAGERVEVVVRHPSYEAQAEITGELRRSLAEDLA